MQTSFYTLLCIVVRIVALATLLNTLVNLPSDFVYLAGTDVKKSTAAAILGTQAVTLALCFALWLFPGLLANLAITRSAREPFESAIDATDLQRIGFGVVGTWFAIEGIVNALYAFGRIAGLKIEYSNADPGQLPLPWLDAGMGLAMFGLGLALTLGSRGLARFLHTLRYGSPAQRPNEETP
jgi:hypothetical protein